MLEPASSLCRSIHFPIVEPLAVRDSAICRLRWGMVPLWGFALRNAVAFFRSPGHLSGPSARHLSGDSTPDRDPRPDRRLSSLFHHVDQATQHETARLFADTWHPDQKDKPSWRRTKPSGIARPLGLGQRQVLKMDVGSVAGNLPVARSLRDTNVAQQRMDG